MTSLSASFQKGKTSLRVSFAHNERTPESVKKLKNKQSHIDAERTKYNVILIGGVDVNDEYEKISYSAFFACGRGLRRLLDSQLLIFRNIHPTGCQDGHNQLF